MYHSGVRQFSGLSIPGSIPAKAAFVCAHHCCIDLSLYLTASRTGKWEGTSLTRTSHSWSGEAGGRTQQADGDPYDAGYHDDVPEGKWRKAVLWPFHPGIDSCKGRFCVCTPLLYRSITVSHGFADGEVGGHFADTDFSFMERGSRRQDIAGGRGSV
ncbi:hypothetical protein R1sor_008487 [Riccia sorocarpa]|uniref:Uncharacterized protein n=1 Tax=Riccia sorocarpa TaxID=122646 RepID=A0ABD3HVP6_9MARC